MTAEEFAQWAAEYADERGLEMDLLEGGEEVESSPDLSIVEFWLEERFQMVHYYRWHGQARLLKTGEMVLELGSDLGGLQK